MSHGSSRDWLLQSPIARTSIVGPLDMGCWRSWQHSPLVCCASCIIGRGFVIGNSFGTGWVLDDYDLLLLGIPPTWRGVIASRIGIFMPVYMRSSFNAKMQISTTRLILVMKDVILCHWMMASASVSIDKLDFLERQWKMHSYLFAIKEPLEKTNRTIWAACEQSRCYSMDPGMNGGMEHQLKM